jgi:uncharacterized protein
MALERMEARFGSNTSIVFLVVAEAPLWDEQQVPDAIRWVTEASWSIEQVVSVHSVATHPQVLVEGDDLLIEELLAYVCPSDAGGCLADRSAELNKRQLRSRLVGRDLKSFAIVADIDLADPALDTVTKIAREADKIKNSFKEEYPGLDIFITGGVPMMQAFYDAAKADSERLMILALLVLTFGLYIFLGGVLPTLLMVLLGASSVLVSMGVAGWMGFVINTATATVPLIVFTLVIAAAMHVFLHIVREEQLNGKENVYKAIRTSVAANWRPVLLTAATTGIGLLSMTLVSAPPLKEVGVLAAVGITSGAVFSVSVIPCLFTFFSRIKASNYLLKLQILMNRYAKWLERVRPRMLPVGLFFVISLIGLTHLTVDEDFVRYFSSDSAFRKDTEAITDQLSGPYHIDVIYDSGEIAGVYSPDAVAALMQLTEFLQGDDRVVNLASILDVLSEMHSVLNGSSPLKNTSADELAQYFLSYELSLGVGQSTRGLIDADHRNARISLLLGDVSMRDIRELDESIKHWAEKNVLADQIVVTGEGIPTAYLSSESIREMSIGILVSVFASALLVGLYFRRVSICIMIFCATVVPILAGFGIWGWISSDIGMAATLVIAITLGVVVDDTIHLTYRYVDSTKNLDLTPWGAIAYSVHKTGTAIVVTSVAIVAGLLVLLGSEFRMNSMFGICSSMVITLALLYNLTLAPALLHYVRLER